jgi:hypothetical protein
MQINSYPQELSTGVQSLWTTRRAHAGVIHILASNLTHRLASQLAGEPLRRIARMRSLVLVGVLCVIGMTPANGSKYSTDHLKLYAHSRLISYDQFICFNKIITKESRWSYTARNNSHYGLGQMRSTWYRDLDPYRQIDASLKYITKRYQTPCKAWAFHQERNYY